MEKIINLTTLARAHHQTGQRDRWTDPGCGLSHPGWHPPAQSKRTDGRPTPSLVAGGDSHSRRFSKFRQGSKPHASLSRGAKHAI